MAASPPNIVVILADDLGYGDISAYGGRVSTPNIDRIGAEGALFTQGYVTTPVCSPSRAALVTGRYQQRYGFEYNAREARDVPNVGLIAGEKTVADHLKTRGYATGHVGKWHLGFQDEHYPTNRGFDEFFGHLAGATNFLNIRSEDALSIPTNAEFYSRSAGDPRTDMLVRGTEPPSPPDRRAGRTILRGPNKTEVAVTDYITDVFAQESASFIRRHKDEPFFLYAAFNAPHSPFEVTQKYYDRFPDVEDELLRIYFGMISALDDAVGTILDELESTGVADNTIVVFLSDNGCAGYFPGLCSCEPLSGGKLTYYEGGVRVPFMARWPDGIESGTRVDVPVSTLDILPTALAAAGIPAPADLELDGQSLLPLVSDTRGTHAGHDTLVWRNYPTIAVRHGNLKLIKPNQDEDGGFLYDLAADMKEQNDLFAARPEDVARLEAEIDAWRKITVEPGWTRRRPVTYSICDIEPIGFEN
ncbi:MAG: sulfatase [Pseudomonadota bacterium]